MTSASVSLCLVLMQTFLVVFLGALVVRMEVLKPEDLKGVGFITARVALPLLIFHAVATAEILDVNLYVIGAIVGSKLIVQLFTIGTMMLVSKKHCGGMTLLRGGLYCLYCTCSADFPIGFPIIHAEFPPGRTKQNFVSYLTMLAVAQDLLGNTVALVTMELGKTRLEEDDVGNDGDVASAAPRRSVAAKVATNIAGNNLLRMVAAGLAYKLLFGWTLVRSEGGEGDLQFPMGLHEAIVILTSPFKFLVLFQLGTSIGSLSMGSLIGAPGRLFLIVVLNVTKLVTLPSLMVSIFIAVWSGPEEERNEFLHFILIFGSLPPPASIIAFARLYDLDADVVASALPAALAVAGPMIWSTTTIFELFGSKELARTDKKLERLMQYPELISSACIVALFVAGGAAWRRFPQGAFLHLTLSLAVKVVVKLAFTHWGCNLPAAVQVLYVFVSRQVQIYGAVLVWLVMARKRGATDAALQRRFLALLYGVPFLLALPSLFGPVPDDEGHEVLWTMHCISLHGGAQRVTDMVTCGAALAAVLVGFCYYKRAFGFSGARAPAEPAAVGDDGPEGGEALVERLFVLPALVMGLYAVPLLILDGMIAFHSFCYPAAWGSAFKVAFLTGAAVAHGNQVQVLFLIFCLSSPARDVLREVMSRLSGIRWWCAGADFESESESTSEDLAGTAEPMLPGQR